MELASLDDIYYIRIKQKSFWEYIPFRKKEINGQEKTYKIATKLIERGYNIQITKRMFRSSTYSYLEVIV